MIVAATGHRAQDISEPHGVVELKAKTKLGYPSKSGKKAHVLICGMANGFDLLAAKAAMSLGIEVWAIRPYEGHSAGADWSGIYSEVLMYASKVETLNNSMDYPGPWVMHARNEWMVDHADVVMAYWSGKEKGGTFACMNYAKKKGTPVSNIFSDPPF